MSVPAGTHDRFHVEKYHTPLFSLHQDHFSVTPCLCRYELRIASFGMLLALESGMQKGNNKITGQQRLIKQNKRILIVEDDATLAYSIAFTLKRYGYEVTSTRSAKEALGLIRSALQEQRPVELLITDIQLPDMTGDELINELASGDALPPTLVMTAYSTNKLFETLKKKGVRECLAKPFDIMELVKRVAALPGKGFCNQDQ
jgi:CheY-like chemotaxis protein